MRCSLNEVQAAGLKAARGAGLSWGLAEDAGRAVRWLEARGLPGVPALGRSLVAWDGMAPGRFQPTVEGDDWSGGGEGLDGLLAGLALLDRRGAEPVTLHHVANPLLLLPSLASLTTVQGAGLTMSVDGDRPLDCQLWPAGPSESARRLGEIDRARRVTVAPGAGQREPSGPVCSLVDGSATIDDDAWRVLEAFAQRTYVPESEESRLRGAGSGESDAD